MTNNSTRGSGLLENLLSKKRAAQADKLIDQKSRQGRILDIGCGSKHVFLNYTKFNEKFGIDQSIQSDLVTQNIKVIKSSATTLPFKDNFFDVVTMLAVIEHIDYDKMQLIAKEINRVLKPNGRFIITTPCLWTDKMLRIMAKIKLVSAEEMQEHVCIYNRRKIEKLLQDSGFRNNKIEVGHFECYLNIYAKADKS